MLVNLKKRIKADGKWTFVAVPRKNGRFLPDKVAEPGTFYIEWREAGRRRQEPVGDSARGAMDALRTKQDELDNDDRLASAGKTRSTDLSLEEACARYLIDIKATKSASTYRQYKVQTKWLLKHTSKQYVSEITRDDIMDLFAQGRDEGSNQKTINLRIIVTMALLRRAGNEIKLGKRVWPKTAERPVEIYEEAELKKFFAACNERERVVFSVFLYSGFRHMEVATLLWDDIDWYNRTLKVRQKPELGFTPKSHEWRVVKVPKALIEMLKDWKEHSTGNKLVFPTKHTKAKRTGGKPDGNMIEQCKLVAYRAGLNCGRCQMKEGSCIDNANCERWYLHKFRHTFATNMLRSNVDIKTLQTLLGHKHISTTEKYLRSLRVHDLDDKIENAVMADLLHTAVAVA